jgi:heat shock protein HslJ
MTRACLSLTAVCLLGACESRDNTSPAPTPPGRAVDAAPVPPPTWEEVAHAAYSGPMGRAFTLQEGQWTGEPYVQGGAAAPRAGLARDFLLVGDLDADGAEEGVVVVWTATGGSGTFDYLVVLERQADGTVAERASAELGDRVQVRSAGIVDGRVVVDSVQAGPGDAMCCPGQRVRRTFILENDTMTETEPEDRGRLSVADLDGDFTLLELNGEALPQDVQITARFEGGQLSGTSACNRYTGRVEGGEAPGDLVVAGPLAVTRKMCPPSLMEWEQAYLRALQGLRKFSFSAGRLVLTWSDENRTGRMLFVAASPSSSPAAE